MIRRWSSAARARRANTLLRAAQIDAERVVALLRIGVSIGLFVTIFLLVRDLPLEGRPLIRRQILLASATLGAYIALGVLSLFLLRRGWFQVWMIWIVVTADCLFLLTNTWFSLVNSGLPGDMMFAMPSVWLIPMVFAFGVLRFNPAIQIYSVLLVVVGHAVLLQTTPDYVVADTFGQLRTALQTPPNMMRLMMICLAGGVLIVAGLRTHALLRRSIREATEKAKLTRYLPSQIIGDLVEQEPMALRQGQQRQAAVLFVDIRGFTRWSEGRAPEEVGAFITEFRRRIERAVSAHQGIIDKYIGDAAMVIFVGKDEAARGVACGQEILREIHAWSDDLKSQGQIPVAVGIGLHLGRVFLGVVGTRDRLEYTVLGDTVNVAARLQEASKATQHSFVTSGETLDVAFADHAPARKDWTVLPTMGLRGRAGDIALFGWDLGSEGAL